MAVATAVAAVNAVVEVAIVVAVAVVASTAAVAVMMAANAVEDVAVPSITTAMIEAAVAAHAPPPSVVAPKYMASVSGTS